MPSYQEIINLLNSDNYYKVNNYINELINNPNYINKITLIDNPFVFDRFIKMCEFKIDTAKLYEERKVFIKTILLNLNNKLSFPDKWINEYIISYYFQDNFYNYMANFFQMVNYMQYTKKILVSSENIKIYNRFKNLNTMVLDEKINLFNEYQNTNIMELFYDDMTKVKEDSHQELVNSSLKLSRDLGIYKKELSKEFGIDIYYLNGEDFCGFVRCFIISRDDLSSHEDYIFSKKNRLGYSFSYIGDKNIGISDYDGNGVVLFYDDIDYHNIMYVHHSDLHAKKMEIQDDYLSEKENEIITSSKLIASTKNYNEIFIKGNDIKPTALICYDTITKNDIAFANKYNLSILLINREKYQKYETYDENYTENTYVL